MKKKSKEINTTELCSYGCGYIAKYINNSKNLMCCQSCNSCPANKKKNSISIKNAHAEGRMLGWNELEKRGIIMNRAWSKGLTKEIDSRVSRPHRIGVKFGSSLTGHTEESKRKISIARTNWLKNPENRKNLGRHKKSWMEETFENFLKENNITEWKSEVHFWSEDLKKNFYPDFLFEVKKLIIELDGNQHLKTKENDDLRDKWFLSLGYKVVRVTHKEFKDRYFSNKGFLDLL